jgi:hypothetical protein
MIELQKGVDTVAVDSQTNAIATATLAAPGVGFKWRVTAVSATYSAAAVATPLRATLVANAVTMGRGVSTNDGWQQSFVNGIDGADNGAVTLALPAGGAGAIGDVVITGVKIPSTPPL